MGNLQKTKWRDKQIGDWVVVHNPVASDPVPEELKPWIGKKGFIIRNKGGCMGDQFMVQLVNPLRCKTFDSGALWWIKPPMTSDDKWNLVLWVSIFVNIILVLNLFLRLKK